MESSPEEISIFVSQHKCDKNEKRSSDVEKCIKLLKDVLSASLESNAISTIFQSSIEQLYSENIPISTLSLSLSTAPPPPPPPLKPPKPPPPPPPPKVFVPISKHDSKLKTIDEQYVLFAVC